MSDVSDIGLRIFLPGYFVLYVLAGGPIAVASFKRKYGFDPTPVAKHDPVMKFGESCRNVIFAVVLLMTFAHAGYPPILAYLGPIHVLERPMLRVAGLVLLVVSLILVRVSQIGLKSSWRFDLDLAAAPTELITNGLYSRSRNPIYVGMAATCVGLFLVLPNAVTLAIAMVAFVILQVRIRVEEQFLLNMHGEAFSEYCRRTPRWLFGRAIVER